MMEGRIRMRMMMHGVRVLMRFMVMTVLVSVLMLPIVLAGR